MSSILSGKKIADFHFKAVFSEFLNTTYGYSIIVFRIPICFTCFHSKMLHPDSHSMKKRDLNALCLSHRAGEDFVPLFGYSCLATT